MRCLSITAYPRQQDGGEPSRHGEADLMLASGSQDNYVRLWRISRVSLAQAAVPNEGEGEGRSHGLGDGDVAAATDLNDAMLDDFERKMRGEGVDAGDDGAGPSGQISTKSHVIRLEEQDGSVGFARLDGTSHAQFPTPVL